jgi:hypothetical protein
MTVVRAVPSVLLALATLLVTGCVSSRTVTVPDGGAVPGNSFVVRDVRVFDGNSVLERLNVVVRNGRIAAIGRAAPPRDLPVVDGTGRTLLPGLIDAHGHVGNEGSLRDALRFGVTTVLDMLTSKEVAQDKPSGRILPTSTRPVRPSNPPGACPPSSASRSAPSQDPRKRRPSSGIELPRALTTSRSSMSPEFRTSRRSRVRRSQQSLRPHTRRACSRSYT